MVGPPKAPQTLAAVRARLMRERNAKDGDFFRGFFKTAPGQYGAGDKFLGIRIPAVRKIVRDFRSLSLRDIETLLHSEWHEARMTAVLMLVDRFGRADAREQARITKLYLANTRYVNNWDLVDASAPELVGSYLAERPRALLDVLAKSKNLWERRIAMVATHHFIRHRDEHDDALRIAAALLNDTEDLLHKASGWMLREVGKRNVSALRGFLAEHAHLMPRTMLRYSIEHFPADERKRWMNAAEAAKVTTRTTPRS